MLYNGHIKIFEATIYMEIGNAPKRKIVIKNKDKYTSSTF